MARIDVSEEVAYLGVLLPENGDERRRVRIALHLVLERAQSVEQLVSELDQLAIWNGQHGHPTAAEILLSLSDSIRLEVFQ
jgi:hypothetical protein